ncbi:MAG: hypothetical protein ACYC6R_10235 [Anaerolineales bacterium]
MKSRLFFWILRHTQYAAISLVAVIAASSCASAGTSVALPTVESLPASGDPATASQATLAPTQIVDIQVVPTSRGPNLEATDPATVALASGQLQLVEFFRFT